jgi:hypothetical protein
VLIACQPKVGKSAPIVLNNMNTYPKEHGVALTTQTNSFYQFTAYHLVSGAYFMNDFPWGSKKYVTLSGQLLPIYVGQEIKINTGVDLYRPTISLPGDTMEINFISPISQACNILTRTGPVHSISDLMYYKQIH